MHMENRRRATWGPGGPLPFPHGPAQPRQPHQPIGKTLWPTVSARSPTRFVGAIVSFCQGPIAAFGVSDAHDGLLALEDPANLHRAGLMLVDRE
jgi:hypothetical protein